MGSPVVVERSGLQVIARVASEADLYPFRTKEQIGAFFEAAPAMFEALESVVGAARRDEEGRALLDADFVALVKEVLARARGVRAA